VAFAASSRGIFLRCQAEELLPRGTSRANLASPCRRLRCSPAQAHTDLTINAVQIAPAICSAGRDPDLLLPLQIRNQERFDREADQQSRTVLQDGLSICDPRFFNASTTPSSADIVGLCAGHCSHTQETQGCSANRLSQAYRSDPPSLLWARR
jgi:hypothetical protein